MGLLEDLAERLQRVEAELAKLQEERALPSLPAPEEPISIREFVRRHPGEWTEASLRWHIEKKRAALERRRAITRLGRRIFINEREFLEAWRRGIA